MRKRWMIAAWFFGGVWLGGEAGCSREPSSPPQPPPNVILITLDTVRADHLGCYGYARPTSPRLDGLAARATLHTRAMASAPWTVPTHASLFTGLYPYEHGARTFKVDKSDPSVGPLDNINPLDSSAVTLAEALREEGYQTAAFVANVGLLSERWQLNQGFDRYDVEWLRADKLNRKIVNWISQHRSSRFFLFINYLDAHRPYNTKPYPNLLEKPVVQDRGQALDAFCRAVLPANDNDPPPEDLVETVTDQYDTAIANLDAQVGVLLDWLQRAGLYDNSLIIITSDHGEYLGEHRLVEHSKDVYQEALHVPLIMKYPGQTSGAVEETPISSADAPGLIVGRLPAAMRDRLRKVFPDRSGAHPPVSENYYTRLNDLRNPLWGGRFDRVRTVIFDWPYKYIHSSDGLHELYHLVDDPRETTNLIEQEAARAERYLLQARRIETRRRPVRTGEPASPLTSDEIDALKALGYLDEEEPEP